MAEILDFQKEYNATLRQKFHDSASALFNRWVKDSKVNIEESRAEAKKYREIKQKYEGLTDEVEKYQVGRNILIVLTVLLFIAFAITLFLFAKAMYSISQGDGDTLSTASIVVPSVLFPTTLILAIVLVVVIVKKVDPKIKDLIASQDSIKTEMNQTYSSCITMLAPLYSQYHDSATHDLVKKVLPIIDLDPDFNMKRLDLLKTKYGYSDSLADNESVTGVFSGEILGNPFVEVRKFSQTWSETTYDGYLTIYWTESYSDKDGHLQVIHRSQTLHASVIKPIPAYRSTTTLVFGSEAAPNLSFSRVPQYSHQKDTNELEKFVKKYEKDLVKKENKALKNGTQFTPLGNTRFEALFQAEDRDNEVEFRLLFTPLAQKNMIDLLLDGTTYGDDFSFKKRKKLNYITSDHAQNWQFDVDSDKYMLYDIDMCKKAFMKYNTDYFRKLYFEFAPLMSIPLYQQYKSQEYIYKDTYDRNYTPYESDVLANALDKSLLKPKDAITETILRTDFIQKDEEKDQIKITAHSFSGVPRVDYVDVFGGDGALHSVPVEWTEYIPTTKVTDATIARKAEATNNQKTKNNATLHNLYIELKNKVVPKTTQTTKN